MAEIFGAVASGAGLVSLAVQLAESSQKLKALLKAYRDAPEVVVKLSYELETMLQILRQLGLHRSDDVSGDELLGRCILTCTKTAGKIKSEVIKMESRLQNSRVLGGLRAAFKEPEIRNLLQDLEQAKSSILLAYMMATTSTQNTSLAFFEMRLQDLDRTVQTGHASILSQLRSPSTLASGPSRSTSSSSTIDRDQRQQAHAMHQSSRKFRLTLPRWFTETVWDFGTYNFGDGWVFQVQPIHIRPQTTPAFDVVRSGNVEAVRRLLASGELSASDCEYREYGEPKALLTIAAEAKQLELCDFLCQQFPRFRGGNELLNGLNEYLAHQVYTWPRNALDGPMLHPPEEFYKLFIGKHGLNIDLQELPQNVTLNNGGFSRADQGLPNPLLREIIANQAVPFETWSFSQRFSASVNSRFWDPEIFVEVACPETLADLALHKGHRGRTALHWAAEHFVWNFSLERYGMQYHGLGAYAKQSVELINLGADLNALDYARGTPLSCMLQAASEIPEYRSRSWLAKIVRHWGYVVGSAWSLDLYAERENTLMAKTGDHLHRLRVNGISDIAEYRLFVSNGSELTIEVQGSFQIQMWEFRPLPGAWEQSACGIDRVPWRPRVYFEGNNSYMWHNAGCVLTQPTPMLMREGEPIPDFLGETSSDALKKWITGVQDDHGFVATKSRKSMGPCDGHRKRRRAASLPPLPISMNGCSMYRTEDTGFLFPGKWLSKAHKCPLDMCWKYSCDKHDGEPDSIRRCMQGRCDDWEDAVLYHRRWQSNLLLGGQRNKGIARRFMNRFHPELWSTTG